MKGTAPGRSGKRPKILHLHSTFSEGGKELRSVRLMNAFGPGVGHAIVSGEPGRMEAARHIQSRIPTLYPEDFPALQGTPTPGRLMRLARAMQPYDLVLTYNWGAIDAAMAHTLFKDQLGLPPLIHHEDGFNEDERRRRKKRRTWFRRLALGKASGLVVPSETLEEIALTEWTQPMGRVKRIVNGIDTGAFAKKPKPGALRGIVKRKGERWVGTLAGLRAVKNLPLLVQAFAALPKDWQLVIVGEGPERDAIRAEAEKLDVAERLHMPGFVPDPARFVGLFDIFALSSDSEQFPISLVEAMAAGCPVVATDVGDVARMVSSANRPFVVPPGDGAALAKAFTDLAGDEDSMAQAGRANRDLARAEYDERAMIDAYRRLYSSAMGREF